MWLWGSACDIRTCGDGVVDFSMGISGSPITLTQVYSAVKFQRSRGSRASACSPRLACSMMLGGAKGKPKPFV